MIPSNSRGVIPCAISTACSRLGDELDPVIADRPVRVAETRGVGSRLTTVRRSGPPVPCTPGPLVSEVRGVGSSAITTFGRPSSKPRPLESRARGVGRPGEDEQALAAVGSADLRRAYKAPLRIEPERGKVGEDGVESESKVP